MKIYSLVLLAILVNCGSKTENRIDQADTQTIFEPQKVVAELKNNKLDEASGLDESYKNPEHLWSHNDSGGEPKLYLLNLNGEIVMEVMLEGVKNRDWEEIVSVKEGDRSFLYVAEMGDNKAVYESLQIIKVEEPKFEESRNVTIPFDQLEIMTFEYREGARDAEALMFDYAKNELVLVTKREGNCMVYSFPFQAGNEKIQIKSVGSVPSRMFTAADAKENGEILLKHYDSIFYWAPSKEPVAKRIIDWENISIPYEPEPQGEAICWLNEDFYTLSEKVNWSQKLLVFKRK